MTNLDRTVMAMRTIAFLRAQKGIIPRMRPAHYPMGFRWVDLRDRGVLARWISLLQHYTPENGGATK